MQEEQVCMYLVNNMSDVIRYVLLGIGFLGYLWMYSILLWDVYSKHPPDAERVQFQIPGDLMVYTEKSTIVEKVGISSKFQALVRLSNGDIRKEDIKSVHFEPQDPKRVGKIYLGRPPFKDTSMFQGGKHNGGKGTHPNERPRTRKTSKESNTNSSWNEMVSGNVHMVAMGAPTGRLNTRNQQIQKNNDKSGLDPEAHLKWKSVQSTGFVRFHIDRYMDNQAKISKGNNQKLSSSDGNSIQPVNDVHHDSPSTGFLIAPRESSRQEVNSNNVLDIYVRDLKLRMQKKKELEMKRKNGKTPKTNVRNPKSTNTTSPGIRPSVGQVLVKRISSKSSRVPLKSSLPVRRERENHTESHSKIFQSTTTIDYSGWISPIYAWAGVRELKAWVLKEEVTDSKKPNMHIDSHIAVNAFRYFGFYVMYSSEPPNEWDVGWGGYESNNGIRSLNKQKERTSIERTQSSNSLKIVYGVPELEILCKRETLYTSVYVPNIRQSFRLPQQSNEYMAYAQTILDRNPYWGTMTRSGFHLNSFNNIILYSMNTPSIVTEYTSNPFLVFGKRLTIGVYILVSRTRPLVIHLYSPDWSVNICENDYFPLTRASMEEACLVPLRKSPNSKELFQRDSALTEKEFIRNQVRQSRLEADLLEWNVQNAISAMFVGFDHLIQNQAEHDINHPVRNDMKYYAIYRIDVEMDHAAKPWIVAVHKNPFNNLDLDSSNTQDFVRNFIKESLVLTGVPSMRTMLEKSITDLVPDVELSIDNDICRANLCTGCQQLKCRLCRQCLTENTKDILRKACLQHRRKVSWYRVLPRPFGNRRAAVNWKPEKDPRFSTMSEDSQLLAIWYSWKCATDESWCR